MADQLEFKISESLIKPILEAKINAAIMEAVGGHEKMISAMITSFLSQRVDSEGKNRGYGNEKPRVEWLAHNMIQEAMKKALDEFITTKKDFIAREIAKYFSSQKGSSQLIAALQDGIVESLKNRWLTTITFKPKE